MDQNLKKFLELYEHHSHFDRAMGLKLKVLNSGEILYHLTIEEHHLSSPLTCHGGVLAGMMDATLGLAALTRVVPMGLVCSTVEFKLNYFAPIALHDQLEGRGIVDHQGKSLVFSSAEIHRLEPNPKLVAKGIGTFNLYPMHKKMQSFAINPPSAKE